MEQLLWETVWPQKIKSRMPYDPEISLLIIYPEELKAGFQRDICTSMFIIFTQEPKGRSNPS